MELNHLRYFYEVAKAGSFTGASRHLRVSQPSLSKTVAQLEAREGVKLLERGKKGVVLTAVGETVFARCQIIFRDLQDLTDLVRGNRKAYEGPLHMGSSDHLANYLLSPRLYAFYRKFPKIIPSLYIGTPTEMVAMILRRDLEFGLFFTRVKAAGIEYRSLAKIEFVVVFRPSSDRVLPKDLAKRKLFLRALGFIGSRTIDYGKNHPAQALLQALGTDSGILLETNSQEMQKRLCLEGYGYAILPHFMVKAELSTGQLVEAGGKERMQTEILLAKRKGHLLSTPAQKFIEELNIFGL